MSLETTSASDSPPLHWSAHLIAGLDWKRVLELIRAISVTAGFSVEKSRVAPDGAAEFEMSRGQYRAVVRLARWNQWMATTECIAKFAERMKQTPDRAGIFVAPEGFEQGAVNLARPGGIECVDGETIAQRLGELPAEHQDFYFKMATAGESTRPSCPVCLRPLTLVNETPEGTQDFRRLQDFVYSTSDIIAERIIARRVEVLERCEVQFLHEVRARDLIVHGITSGTFLCESAVVLNPGAILYGSVAARSVVVRPGAQLIGETKILDGSPEPFVDIAPASVWRCRNKDPRPGCEQVSFLPH